MRLTSLKETEETHNKNREANGKLELPQAPHQMFLSPVNTSHGPEFPACDLSVMSVPADVVDRLRNFRS